jgi:hypothetical protein
LWDWADTSDFGANTFGFEKAQENQAPFAGQLDGGDHIRTHKEAQTRNAEDQKD